MAKKTVLIVKNLVKTYGAGKNKTEAVRGISFEIKQGEFVALAGPSGSGKSTTFQQIALLDNPTSGEIFFNGIDIVKLNREKKAEFRLKKIGYVFQNYELLQELTAAENIFLPLMVQGEKMVRMNERADRILDNMGLLGRKDHYPNELSGGEQQRIAIARALAKKPEIILADEPTSHLDSFSGQKVIEILRHLNKEYGITVFVINHEKYFEKYFDRIIRIKDGKLDRIDINKNPSKIFI